MAHGGSPAITLANIAGLPSMTGGTDDPIEATSTTTSPDVRRAVARWATEDDIPAIDRLLRRAFGQWPAFPLPVAAQEHLAWKMSPQALDTPHILIEADGRVILVSLRLQRRVAVQQRVYRMRDATDRATDPVWQRRNLNQVRRDFRARHGDREPDLSGAWLPHHPVTRRQTLEQNQPLGNAVRMWWRPSSLRTLVGVTRAWGGARQTIRGGVRHAIAQLRPRPSALAPPSTAFATLPRFDDRTDALWARVQPAFDFAVVRDQAYMNWRYADRRAGRFRIRALVTDAGTILGYAISKQEGEVGAIVDLVAPIECPAVCRALVGDAVEGLARQGAADVRCWLPRHHPYNAALVAWGFIDSGRSPTFTYRPRAMPADDLAFLADPTARVHLTEGDSDLV